MSGSPRHSMSHVRLTVLATAALAAAGPALPSGFRVPPASAAGLGFANAIVANPEDFGATPYNPAAVGFHKGWIASLGVLAIDSDLKVSNDAGTTSSSSSSPAWAPNGFIEGPLVDRVRWSLVFDTPFGQQTNWPPGAFPAFQGQIAGLAPTQSKIDLYSITPSLAWTALPSLSLFAGVDYYNVREAKLDTTLTSLSGNGDAFGWSVGLMYSEGPWSVGLTYRAAVDIDIGGTFSTPIIGSSAITTLPLPARAQLGLRYKHDAAFALEADLDYTGWSRFKTITIDHSNPSASTPIVNINDWRDTVALRLGAAYWWRPETMLRIGYAYEQGAMPDAHFSARDPDSSSNTLSVGIGQTFGGWRLDAAYMYVWYASRTFSTSVPFGTYGFDANGTVLYNGTYENSTQLLAVSVSYQF